MLTPVESKRCACVKVGVLTLNVDYSHRYPIEYDFFIRICNILLSYLHLTNQMSQSSPLYMLAGQRAKGQVEKDKSDIYIIIE